MPNRDLPTYTRVLKWLRRVKKSLLRPAPAKPRVRNPRAYLGRCEGAPRAFECLWARLSTEPMNAALLGELVGSPGASFEQGLRTLLPALEHKQIVDVPLATPREFVVEPPMLAAQKVTTPLDWTDAETLRDSRIWYQSLRWIDRIWEDDGTNLELAAYVVVDWNENALSRDPPLDLTWDEHAMSARLDAIERFLRAYIDNRERVDRRVLRAALRILLSHLYGLALELCYVPRHNHGLMQDRTLLIQASRLPALVDSQALVALAEERLLSEQVAKSVTSDFIHIENSPTYQLLLVNVLTLILNEAYFECDRTPPPRLEAIRDGLLDAFAHLVQPNLCPVPFGDSLRGDTGYEVRKALRAARVAIPIDPEVVARIEYVLYHGTHGTEPPLDRVFERGGYASFRERWGGDDTESIVAAYFKGARGSTIHYHEDETSFHIYGFGDELVVDPGRYANDRKHPMARIAAQASSHNLLIVNRKNFDHYTRPSGIVAHGIDDGLAWVQATHTYYASEGLTRYMRSFVFFKPRTFVVVDSFRSLAPNLYEQHFHLHPSLSKRDDLEAGIIAKREDGAGLVLQPFLEDAEMRVVEGKEDPSVESWYFPRPTVAEPMPDVIFRRHLPAGTYHLPAVMALFAADEASVAPEVTLASEAGGFRLQLVTSSGPRELFLDIL